MFEKGLSVFMDRANLTGYHQGKNESSSMLPDMVDALVWADKGFEKYLFKTGHEYLPQYCLN